MVIKEDYLQWYTSFLIKNLLEVALNKIDNLQMNFRNQLLEDLKEE